MAQESQHFQSTFVLNAYKRALSVYPFYYGRALAEERNWLSFFILLQRAKMKKSR